MRNSRSYVCRKHHMYHFSGCGSGARGMCEATVFHDRSAASASAHCTMRLVARAHLADIAKNIIDSQWNHARVLIAAHHRVCLAAAGLAVREHGAYAQKASSGVVSARLASSTRTAASPHRGCPPLRTSPRPWPSCRTPPVSLT
jgi:hypothetical protein